MIIIVGIVCLIVGFAAGFLVYRNNVKNLQEKEKTLREEISTLKSRLG